MEGKKILKHDEKYYLYDLGFRQAIIGNNNKDISRVIENIMFLELLRRGYEITIGKIDNLEVDFMRTCNNSVLMFSIKILL